MLHKILFLLTLCIESTWGVKEAEWLQITGSCLKWDAGERTDAVEKTSLEACMRSCLRVSGCLYIQYFESRNQCFMFDDTCKMDGEEPDWLEKVVGEHSTWMRVNGSKTITSSVTVTVPTRTATETEEEDEAFKIPSRWYVFVTPFIVAPLLISTFLFQIWRDGGWSSTSAEDPYESITDLEQQPNPLQKAPSTWQRGRILGKGSFGSVYLGVLPDGSMQAVKVIELAGNLTQPQLTAVTKEVKILSSLRHRSIVSYKGCRYDPWANELHVFMEYMPGGSLNQLVKKLGGTLHEATAVVYIKQILEGVSFVHSKGLVHRDIKGDNILLAADGKVKLADFGACSKIQSTVTSGMVGTPLWMSPEVISNRASCSASSDIWAVGIVVAEILNEGVPPWPRFDNHMQAIYQIAGWVKPLPPNLPKGLSSVCLGFLRHCHHPISTKRPSAVELLRHAWLRVTNSELACSTPPPIIESEQDLHHHYSHRALSSTQPAAFFTSHAKSNFASFTTLSLTSSSSMS